MPKISKTKQKVLDTFESRKDMWHDTDFERELEQAMGRSYGNYQTAKMTILEADRAGLWPATVEQYVRSNHARFGNLPAEFHSIGQRLGL